MKKLMSVFLLVAALFSGCIKKRTGDLVIVTDTIVNNEVLTVKLDGVDVGKLSEPCGISPQCVSGPDGIVRKNLSIGVHTVTATNPTGFTNWTAEVEIFGEHCNVCIL